jgi:hypothetical protein
MRDLEKIQKLSFVLLLNTTDFNFQEIVCDITWNMQYFLYSARTINELTVLYSWNDLHLNSKPVHEIVPHMQKQD